MVSRNFSRLKHVICYEVAGFRTETKLRSYSTLEEEKVAAFEMEDILRNDGLCPKHGLISGSLLVIPEAICLSYRISGGPVDHAV